MDKIKLYPQERLDLDDARAIQNLVYDYVAEALGGLLGHMRGALSAPVITQTENSGAPYIELSAFQFITSTPVEASANSVTLPSAGLALTQFKNTVVTYTPSEENSTQISIDTARAYYQDYVGAYLWARPIYVDTDTATRIKWDVSQGAEVSFNDETRESQRVAFAVSVSAPAYSAGEAKWAPIARITAWSDEDNSGSLASWQTISAFEHDTARSWIGGVSGDNLARSAVTFDYLMGTTPLYPMEQGRSYRGIGLADQIAILRYKMAQMQGHGVNDPASTPARNWYLPPLSSLNGLDTEVQTIRGQRSSQIVCIASAEIQAQYLPASLDYQFTLMNAVTAVGIDSIRASTVRTNRVSIELSQSVLSEDWNILHVSCSQQMYREGSNNVYDYNRVNFQIDRDPYVLSNTAYNRLDDYATTNGRGITIELLPHFATNEEAIDDTHAGHNHVNLIISEQPTDNHDVFFSVAIFARHSDQ